MRAIFINSKTGKVEEVDNDGSLESIRNQLSCQWIELIRVNSTTDMYVDEEARLHNTKYWFFILSLAPRGYESKIFGSGLIFGRTLENCTPYLHPVKTVEDLIVFPHYIPKK